MKTISDKIFELLKEKGMSQKEFAQRTGIAESSISDWKKKRTNPVSDKILIICEVLGLVHLWFLPISLHKLYTPYTFFLRL